MKKRFLLLIILMLLVFMPNVDAKQFWSSMPNDSYIIGEYLYTRSSLGDYKGVLKTQFIMMASKSIDETDLSSMVIYYKSPRGIIKDGLSGEELTVDETQLMEKVKYYNGKEIPSVSALYLPDNYPAETNYKLYLNFDYKTDNKLDESLIKWDVYGAKEWDGVLYNPVGVTSNEENSLTLLEENASKSYSFTLENDDYYNYVGYPYFYDGENKIYLNNTDAVTVYGGAEINYNVENHKVTLSVTGIENYTIKQAALFASRRDKKGSHMDMRDLHMFTKNNPTAIGVINDYFNSVYEEFMNFKLARIDGFNSSFDYYLADMYAPLSNDINVTSVDLYDLGNSEQENHDYFGAVLVSSPDILDGRSIMVSTKNTITTSDYIDQPTYHELTEDDTSVDLIGSIVVTSAMLEAFGDDYFDSDYFDNLPNNTSYDGGIMYNTSITMSNEFSINVPEVFADKSESYSYKYEYKDENEFNKCDVELLVVAGYSDANELINQMITYYTSEEQNPSAATTETINGIDWKIFSIENEFNSQYFYATTKNNKVYLLKFDIMSDALTECQPYRTQILNSIQSK